MASKKNGFYIADPQNWNWKKIPRSVVDERRQRTRKTMEELSVLIEQQDVLLQALKQELYLRMRTSAFHGEIVRRATDMDNVGKERRQLMLLRNKAQHALKQIEDHLLVLA